MDVHRFTKDFKQTQLKNSGQFFLPGALSRRDVSFPALPSSPFLKEYQSKSNHPQQPPEKAWVLLREFLIRWRRSRGKRICFFENGWDMGHFVEFFMMFHRLTFIGAGGFRWVVRGIWSGIFFAARLILGRRLLSVVDGICNPWCLPVGEVIDNTKQSGSRIPEGRSFLFCSVDKKGGADD